ncbi:MAG: lysophospholipid acyltransferase family protein [Elusimicrobiota bacterium]
MNPVLAAALRAPLHGLGLLVAALPRSVELSLGRALGRFALAVDPKRRRIARENITRCLPDLGPEARESLLRANYEHYGILTLELLHIFTPVPGHWREYVKRTTRLDGFENWKAAHDKGRGALFCSAHLANWELMAAAGALSGIPITIVTRRLKPEWLHAWMEKTRLSVGVRALYQPHTLPGVLRGLRDRASVGFVMDQYMPPPMGKPLRFFGALVNTLTAIAPLARRTRAPITPVTQRRGADGTVVVAIEPEFPLGAADDADNQRLSDLVESWIRAEPAQWLWAHRRFKNVDWSDAAAPQRGTDAGSGASRTDSE